MKYPEQRLSQSARSRVSIEHRGASLAIKQDGGDGRTQIAVSPAVHPALKSARPERLHDASSVPGRRVAVREALDEPVRQERGRVPVPEEVREEGLGFVHCVALL